jgi:12-hydroxyjasmonoyl-L-amino acid 12-hydroxylase / fatty acid hydroxylase
MEIDIPHMQNYLFLLFLTFSVSFLIFSLIVLLLRLRPWCNCDICKTYLTSSWRSEFTNLSDWYTHLLRASPTGTVHIHVLRNTITANPANVEHILKTRFENYPKGRQFSSILGDLLGQGIFNTDGVNWRFQRKMASLELGRISVRSYAFKTVSKEIEHRLIPFLESISARDDSTSTFDIQDVFRRFAFDTICKLSFGLDPGCLGLGLNLPMSDFANAFDTASRLSAGRATTTAPVVWKLQRFLNVGSEKELKRAIRLVDNLAEAVIHERRKIGFSASHDLLSRFMAAVDEEVDDK